MKRDNRIELYRFIFACIIMIFHAHNVNNGQGHPIPLGHVFVEFFFFLTGYFTYQNIKKGVSENKIDISVYPFQYTWKKILKFYPYIIMTAIFYALTSIVFSLFRGYSIKKSILEFSGMPFDILLLQITGICKNPNFNAWWYLSALIFLLPLVSLLFYGKYVRGGGYTYTVYFAPLLIYGAFAVRINGLDWETELCGIIRTGLFRGFAGLCVGCLISDVKDKFSKVRLLKSGKIFVTIVEVGTYIISIIIAWKYNGIENSTFLIVLLLIIGLIITFSNQSYTIYLDKNIFGFLGKISLPLYICHYSCGRILGKYLGGTNVFENYVIYYSVSFGMALCMLLFNRTLLRGTKIGLI